MWRCIHDRKIARLIINYRLLETERHGLLLLELVVEVSLTELYVLMKYRHGLGGQHRWAVRSVSHFVIKDWVIL